MCKLFKKLKQLCSKTEVPYEKHVKFLSNITKPSSKYTCDSNRNINRALFRNRKVINNCATSCCIGCSYIKTCSFPCPMRHNCKDYK